MPTFDDLTRMARRRSAAAAALRELEEQHAAMTKELVGELARSVLVAHPTVVRFALSARSSEFDDNGPDPGVHLHAVQFEGDAAEQELRGYPGAWRSLSTREVTPEEVAILDALAEAVEPLSAEGLLEMAYTAQLWEDYFLLQVDRTGVHLTSFWGS